MSFRDHLLYHQIHPAKILTDFSAGTVALIALWRHHAVLGLLIVGLPPLAASVMIMSLVDLRPYQSSMAGRYMKTYITRRNQVMRLVGFAVMMLAAWEHAVPLLAVGFLVVVICWFYGLLLALLD